MRETQPENVPAIQDEAPPFLERWPRVYTFVLIYLACVIAAFYFVTRYFTA